MWIRGKGDAGYTSLLSGTRVPKYDEHPDAYGTVDEATSFIGLARVLSDNARIKGLLLEVQTDLHWVMADLALGDNQAHTRITAADVDRLDQQIDAILQEMPLPEGFVAPGNTGASAMLDVARAVVRRAERIASRLLHDGAVNTEQDYRYLNRLSSLLYTLARYDEFTKEIPYALIKHPGEDRLRDEGLTEETAATFDRGDIQVDQDLSIQDTQP